jgi:hypothetical protein
MEGSTDPARTLGEAALRDWPSGSTPPALRYGDLAYGHNAGSPVTMPLGLKSAASAF